MTDWSSFCRNIVLTGLLMLTGCSSSSTTRSPDTGDDASDENPRDVRVDTATDTSRPEDGSAPVDTSDTRHPTDISDREDGGPTDTSPPMDIEDGGNFDASGPRDARTDTDKPSDATEEADTFDGGADTEDAKILPPHDGGERRDTSDRDVGFVCPAPREFRGVCGSPIYCCKNEELQKKCQYGKGCAIPESIDQDPEWNCFADLCKNIEF